VENNVKLAPDKTLSTWVGGAQRHSYSYNDVVFKLSNEYSFSLKISAMSLQSRLMIKKREEKNCFHSLGHCCGLQQPWSLWQ
jgi:hypothetical protein